MTGFGRAGAGKRESGKAGEWGTGRAVFPTQRLSRAPAHPVYSLVTRGSQPDFLALAKGLTAATCQWRQHLPRNHLRRIPGKACGVQNIFSWAQLHRQSTRRVGGSGEFGIVAEPGFRSRAAEAPGGAPEGTTIPLVSSERWRHQAGWFGSRHRIGQGLEKREPFPVGARIGTRVCQAMARRGVLTRPIGDVIVLMPPYCATAEQVKRIVSGLREAIHEITNDE